MRPKLVKLLLSAVSLLSLTGIVASSIAWFNPKATILRENDELTASTMGAYFAYGNGASNNVYGITKPRHLYNLAWLQYLGFFKDSEGNPTQPYFRVDNDIDMSEIGPLPPIGTTDHPFIGNFDGGNHTISGLTVSNDFNEYTTYPYDVEGRFVAPQIVGFFGVVGQYEDNEITYSSQTNVIANTKLEGATIKTVTSNTLAGIAAGYVNGTLNKVAVNNSKINVKNNLVRHLADFDNISNYTIVGYCTDDYKSTLTKLTDTSYQVYVDPTRYTFSAQTQGSDADWGGSLNMKDMYNRLVNVYNASGNTTTQVTGRTYYHNADGTTTYNSNEDETSSGFKRNHSRTAAGNFSTIQGNQTTYMYLQGGMVQRDITYQYATHTGYPISKGDHYLRVSNFTANGGTLTDGNSENATMWTLPVGNSGYVYTTYYYDKNSDYTTYYLYNNNGTLTLSKDNKTTWYKDVSENGSIKLYDGYFGNYIDYDNGWKLRNYATDEGVYDEPVDAKTFAQEVAAGTYTNNSYQLYETVNGVNYYMNADSTTDNSKTTATTTLSKGWTKDNNDKLSIKVGNTSMYTYGRTQNTEATEVVSRASSGDALNISVVSGNTYKIYWTYRNTKYYMFFNTSNNLFVSQNNSNKTIKYESTETVYNREIYNPIHNEYVVKHPIWEQNHTIWESNWTTLANLDAPVLSSRTGTDSHITEDTGERMTYGADNTTYFPLNVSKDGSSGSLANGDYDAIKSNTGYVISGSRQNTSMSEGSSLIRVSQYGINNINASYTSGDGQIKPTKVYTIDENGVQKTMNQVSDDKKTKFEDTRSALYKNALNGSSYVYGLHFLQSSISMNDLVDATGINILGTNYDNYQMPVNSIDFNLKQKGYINFMAGSYYSATVVNFFSLHKIYRSGTNITNIKEISEIYGDGAPNHSYIYKFTDGTYTTPYRIGAGNKRYEMSPNDDGIVPYNEALINQTQFNNKYASTFTKLFDTNSIANYSGMNITQNALYYFEIPMNDGEFCLGSSSSGAGGYLLYLDIGANATKVERTIAYEHISHSEATYEYPKGIAFGDNSTTVDARDNACMTIKDGYSGDFSVSRNTTTDSFTVTTNDWDTSKLGYYKESITGINTATAVGDSTDFTENTEGISSTLKDTRRMEYIDHNVNQNEYIRTIVADTKTNGVGNYVRDYVEQRYQDGSTVPTEDVEIFSNEGAKIANDNGGKYATTLLLPTDAALYSDEVLAELRIELDNSQTATIDWNMELKIDETAETGTYYIFKDYKATYTVGGNVVTVIVRKWDERAHDIYVGSTEVTYIGQTVDVQVTPTN